MRVHFIRNLSACRHCCWLELQLRELWRVRINTWECCKEEADSGCQSRSHRCWMKYLRNTFGHTHMLIEYLIVLDDYWSRLLNWGNLFFTVLLCVFFKNLGRGEAGQNYIMMSLSIQQILSYLLLSAWESKAFWQLQKVLDDKQRLTCFSCFNLFVLGV